MWKYIQSTGELFYRNEKHPASSADGFELICHGYSGSGEGKNNPTMQFIANKGPIPAGDWTISDPFHHPHPPYKHNLAYPVMRLSPAANTYVNHRGNFLIHGDNASHTASDGCIILNKGVRQLIAKSKDHDLQVVGQLGDFERTGRFGRTA